LRSADEQAAEVLAIYRRLLQGAAADGLSRPARVRDLPSRFVNQNQTLRGARRSATQFR
jgi:hypothetical protein